MQECGECTLCCKMMFIKEMHSLQGEYCNQCLPNKGCRIYGEHPEECKTFQCCYVQMEKVHIDLRPDRCNVVFEKINNELILASIDGVLKDVSDLIYRQIKHFINEGISVMLQQFNPHKFICYHVKGASRNDIIKALEDKANDSTKLYRRLN